MKTKILVLGLMAVGFAANAQWTTTGDNTTSGSVGVTNPNNSGASVYLSWLNDVPRLQVGGVGVGAGNGFDIQGISNTTLLRVKGNGNIGIGTTAPSEKLEVYGNGASIKLSSNSTSENYNIKLTANYDYNNIFTMSHGTHVFMQEKKINDAGGNSSSKLLLSSYYGLGLSAGVLNPSSKDDIDLFIMDNGNVGIGTTTPTAKLESVTPNGNSSSFRLGRADNANYWNVNHAGNDFRLYNNAASGSNILFGVDPAGGVKNNNVGIGTAEPIDKLHIEGTNTYLRLQTNSFTNTAGIRIKGKRENGTTYSQHVIASEGTSSYNLGISADEHLFLKTNATTRMTVSAGGNIGIGTIDPKSKLHIYNQVNGAFNGLIIDNRKTYGANSGINETSRLVLSLSETNHNALNRIFGVVEAGTTSETTSANGRLSFYVRENGVPSEKMRINHNGNVGIGTATPSNGKLEIKGNGASNGITIYSGISNESTSRLWTNASANLFHISRTADPNKGITIDGNGDIGIGTTSPTNKLSVNGFIKTQGADGRLMMENPSASTSVYLRNSGNSSQRKFEVLYGTATKMVMDNDGNLGIGTAILHPDYKLAVEGKIKSQEVKVTLDGWADFVFEDTYQLPSLEQVEKHIQENGHLENIPTTEEVVKDGIYLGNMNVKLLQKIEELTLYTIEQEKEIKALKNQNSRIEKLEKENKELQSISKRLEALEKLVQK